MDRDKIRAGIKTAYGLTPTEDQINEIVEKTRDFKDKLGRSPQPKEWRTIVETEVPAGRGQYKEAAFDDSDINDIITDIIDQTNQGGQGGKP